MEDPSGFSIRLTVFIAVTALIVCLNCISHYALTPETEEDAETRKKYYRFRILKICLLVFLSVYEIPFWSELLQTRCFSGIGTAAETISVLCAGVVFLILYLPAVLLLPEVLCRKEEEAVTEEEIISLVDEGNESGVLEDNEAEMIRNIFDLNDTDAREIMTHRQDIAAINGNIQLHEALAFMLSQNNSRFPVFSDSIDNLLGIVYLRDLVQYLHQNDMQSSRLADCPELLRPINYIPETKTISRLFEEMQSTKNQIAIVIDEYGQTAGLITMEDILEEIVGNIQDEYDEEEEEIQLQQDGSWILLGSASMDDVEDALDTKFTENTADTLNGFLIALLEHIPAEDEKVEIAARGIIFRVIAFDNNMIKRVRAVKGQSRQEE